MFILIIVLSIIQDIRFIKYDIAPLRLFIFYIECSLKIDLSESCNKTKTYAFKCNVQFSIQCTHFDPLKSTLHLSLDKTPFVFTFGAYWFSLNIISAARHLSPSTFAICCVANARWGWTIIIMTTKLPMSYLGILFDELGIG